jgi:cytochrome c oxidase assembly protein subunit 15
MASLLAATTARQPVDRTGPVRAWLAVVALMVVAMVLVGGATRLTDSGLSITEWQPILGAIPPLSEADWQAAFAKYRQIPEYRLINKGMSLEAFKVIYWWEWAHRFLGRLIGLAFALPLAVLWLTGRIPRGYGLPLLGVLALGGLQGVIGWYMVQSGLVDRIDVSPYRLALHLSVAILILCWIVWLLMDLSPDGGAPQALATLSGGDRALGLAVAALLALQIVIGGFVAGLKAGLTYNTWPLMDGRLIPAGLATLEPWYLNLSENVTTVQFLHRGAAYLLVAAALVHAIGVWRRADDDRPRLTAAVLAAGLLLQAALGVATLLAAADGTIPIGLGLAHQVGAALLAALTTAHLHALLRRR